MDGSSAPAAPAAPSGGALALSPAAVGGRRHHKMRKVSAKTIKRTLHKLGMKPKGRVVLKGGEGEVAADGAAPAAEGGRRRSEKKTKRRSASRRSSSIFKLY